jgi:RNA polymerase sigma-70 factor (ECF subfamily)
VHDADDAVQETLLGAWRGLPRFEGRSSLRTWLYTIATNACLRASERRARRMLAEDAGPPAFTGEAPGRPVVEDVWIEPYPDGRLGPDATYEQRETLELAFVAAVNLLPPLQRAVLLLREVLAFSAQETAAALETTPAAVNSALQRARKTVDERLPAETQQTALQSLGDEAVRGLVSRYMQAMEAADVEAVVALLAEDAVWAMPPLGTWYRGLTSIEPFLRDHCLRERWRHLATAANGQPAVLSYRWDAEAGVFRAFALDVLSLRGGRIAAVDAFLDPAVFPGFGLPAQLRSTRQR